MPYVDRTPDKPRLQPPRLADTSGHTDDRSQSSSSPLGRCTGGHCRDRRHPIEALEALGQFDGRFGRSGHERSRSNTRPRKQKLMLLGSERPSQGAANTTPSSQRYRPWCHPRYPRPWKNTVPPPSPAMPQESPAEQTNLQMPQRGVARHA